ncbi:hypothetical protein ACPEEZ_06040 [Frigoribacterium sp. 2-23]|uniref:hypothetical protein n=1 Tax=Frigoribacterium sp. 2-23 TaxID=3415006 RepID=UPI003C6F3912
MATSRDDPGRGDPTGIRRLVALREDTLLDIASAKSMMTRVGEYVTPEVWQGGAKQAFMTTLSSVHSDLSTLVFGIELHDDALRLYASKLEAIQDTHAELTIKQARAEAERAAATADLFSLTLQYPSGPGLSGAGEGGIADALRRQGLRTIETVEHEIAVLEERRDQLVVERDTIDAECIAALTGVGALGPLASITLRPIGAEPLSGDDLLRLMSSLTLSDIALLFADSSEPLQALHGLDPATVRLWWDNLAPGPLDAYGLGPVQAALVAAAPKLFGALDGVPVLARVRANQIAAERRVTELTRRIATLDPVSQRRLIDDACREREYLARAVSGEIQLYVYDKTTSRIVEMVGTLDGDTTHVVTYVPGTLASMDDFYRNGTQQVSSWLHDNSDGHTVAFVYKDGKFAGEGREWYPDIAFLDEANSPSFTRATGATLARFQAGIGVDPLIAGTSSTAIGHSWGLANVTASETAGARYDRVISLAGAGMAPEWQPNPGTRYADFSYYDILMLAQETGQVWNGNNPRAHDAFEHGEYFEGPRPATYISPTPTHEGQGFPRVFVMTENHGLVAQDVPENEPLLQEMNEWILR